MTKQNRKSEVGKSRVSLAPDKYLSSMQVSRLRAYVDSQADIAEGRCNMRDIVNKAIVDVLLNSGLRAAEFCQLQVRDLPLYHSKPVIDVRKGKGCIRRSVQISSALAERIKRFVRRYRRSSKPRSFLFVNERGGPLSYDSLRSKLRIIGSESGIGRLTPHMLRHTYAMCWYGGTKDLFGLADQLGHKDVTTTHIYARTTPEEMRRQVEDFDL